MKATPDEIREALRLMHDCRDPQPDWASDLRLTWRSVASFAAVIGVMLLSVTAVILALMAFTEWIAGLFDAR